jgi:hypothetical protein
MKISYRTHPLIEDIYKKEISDLKCFESDKVFVTEHKASLKDTFSRAAKLISDKIYIFREPFMEAYEKAADKLYKSNLWNEVSSGGYCLIMPDKEATLLEVRKGDKIEENDFVDDRTGHVMLFATGFKNDVIIYSGVVMLWFYSDKIKTEFQGWKSNNIDNVEKHILNSVLLTLFIKFAQIETKFLKPGEKLEEVECNYKNETKLPITIYDSKWFTTLVKSDGFKVRGHFRLQPKKKDGQWTKELIWISDFQKEGYTAPARRLSLES